MILILCFDKHDKTTNLVIDYLNRIKANYFRLNADELFKRKIILFYYLSKDGNWEFEFEYKDQKIISKDITSVWYRRGFTDRVSYLFKKKPNSFVINNFLRNEIITIYNLFETALEHVFWLNKISNSHNEKLLYLSKAKKAGLNVPKPYILNHSNTYKKLNSKKLITKAVTEAFVYNENEKHVPVGVERLKNLPNGYFFPSFCQEEINTQYEIRVFYLVGKTFSIMQSNESVKKTEVDVRNSENIRKSRYRIPSSLSKSIDEFMKSIGLNSGSLDFIKDENENYIFLEVNPIGQIDYVSISGNYFLEKEIANLLYEKSSEYIRKGQQ